MKPGVHVNQGRENSPPNRAANPQPQQTNIKKEFHISQATKDRANACKAYIERTQPASQHTLTHNSLGKYSKLKTEEQEKKDGWEQLHKKMDDMNMSSAEQELIKRDIIHKESDRYRKKYIQSLLSSELICIIQGVKG